MIRGGRVYRTTTTISGSSSDSENDIPVRNLGPYGRRDSNSDEELYGVGGDTTPTNANPVFSTATRNISVSSSDSDSFDGPPARNQRRYRPKSNISRGGSEDEETSSTEIYPMERFPYPGFWDNDDYMDLLMDAFRSRAIDPGTYDNKMKFWQEMISVYGLYKRNAVFNKRELIEVFRRRNRQPSCLDAVIEDMMQTKQLRIRSEYEYNPTNNWLSWAISNFVNKPLIWGLRKIPFIGGAEQDPAVIEYVHLDVIRVFCEDIQTLLLQYVGQIRNFETLAQQIEDEIHLQFECIEMCLQTLHAEGRIGLEYIMEANKKHIHLVKIPGESDRSIEITQTNRAVYNLQKTQAKLMQNLATIEEAIKVNEERARQYVNDGKKQLAKTYLRKKLLLEKSHGKRSIALHNIETLICNVEEAQTNGVIMDAYKIGSKALQNLLNASGLKFDNVDGIISEVRDSIDTHNELQESLANVNIGDSITGGNDDELESELMKIVGEQANEDAATKAVAANAPPTSLPFAKKQSTIATQVNIGQDTVACLDEKTTESHQPAEISDAELLAMLEGLEVEENLPVEAPTKFQTA